MDNHPTVPRDPAPQDPAAKRAPELHDDDAGLDEEMPDVEVNDSVTPEHPVDQ
ncbi:hypothetical protein ACSMEV_15100 [Pseudomonas sp. MLB6B]